jgi:arginine/lysine/ornithine decarboxylase
MAVLHISPTCRIDPARVKFYVNALTTTSPSYMLLAATDFALAKLWREPHLFDDYVQRLRNFRTQMPRENAPLTLVETDDIGKLFFKINADIDIQKALHDDYKIEIEAATPTHFLCMTSVADTDEGFSRLRSAMHELNDTLPYAPKPASTEIFAHPAYF